LKLSKTSRGATLAARTKSKACYPTYDRTRQFQDFCIVSSFVLWAALLGFGPVITYRILLG
jgi:hypothetical protein